MGEAHRPFRFWALTLYCYPPLFGAAAESG